MDENLGDLNEASETATAKRSFGIFLWVLVGLAVYVFSVGPAAGTCKARFERNGDRDDKLIRAAGVFYTPLIALAESRVGRPLVLWIHWWERSLSRKT